jgi:drug/metabolite transporter (DMT)-like permease
MAILLGLCVAALIGTADFLGGFTSRRSTTGSVVCTSQAVSLLVATFIVLAFSVSVPPTHDLLIGLGVGAAAIIGIPSLYRGLAGGRMSVVASISAIGAGVIPILWAVVRGERPSLLALLGALLAIGAVVLVARPASGDRDPDGELEPREVPRLGLAAELGYSVVAAFGFGVATTLFSEVGNNSGAWTILAARLVTVPIAFVAVALVLRGPLVPHRRDLPLTVGIGIVEAVANLVLVYAFRGHLTSLVAPVTAVYPAMTVLLARAVLGEHLGRVRTAGLALTLFGLVLIAAG